MRTARLLLPALALALALACGGTAATNGREDAARGAPTAAAECRRGGCSGELCTDEEVASPCIWKDEFACYRDATCARQADGRCGWTMDAALEQCLAKYGR